MSKHGGGRSYDREHLAPQFGKPGERCRICRQTKLSRYNPQDVCAGCTAAARHAPEYVRAGRARRRLYGDGGQPLGEGVRG